MRTASENSIGLNTLQTRDSLGLSTHQVEKLVGSGFLDRLTDRLIDAESVGRLAAFSDLTAADFPVDPRRDETASVMVAVHCGPVQPTPNEKNRDWMGVDLANRDRLRAKARSLAWTGNWPILEWKANRLLGGILVADVSGFLSPDLFAIRVDSFSRVTTECGPRTVFHGAPLDEDETAMLRDKRIRSKQGSIWQWLSGEPA